MKLDGDRKRVCVEAASWGSGSYRLGDDSEIDEGPGLPVDERFLAAYLESNLKFSCNRTPAISNLLYKIFKRMRLVNSTHQNPPAV